MPVTASRIPTSLCPSCGGTGWAYNRELRASRRCECYLEKIRNQKLAEIPPKFEKVANGDQVLRNVDGRGAGQFAVLERMRDRPDSNYLFWGATGTGKTFLGYLLYREAVMRNKTVTAITTLELVKQFRYEIECRSRGEQFSPTLTPDRLRKPGARHFILLDEFTNAVVTPFAAERIFELVDVIYREGHQLVVTSQYDPDEIKRVWSRFDPSLGEAIARRVLAMCASFGL